MRPTKRSILNLTSRKKRDVMLQTSNTSSTGAAIAPAVGATVVNGSNGGWFYWSPTARDLDTVAGQPNTVSQEASRTSTTCFARGLSERLDIQTSSSVPWKWRRICFWTKSKEFLASASGATFNYKGWLETSAGVSRAFINSFLNNNNSQQGVQSSILFAGTEGQDWTDIMVAKVDTRRVDLVSDKTTIINSGNDSGVFRKHYRWYGMNKNVVYDDDQIGDEQNTSAFSVTDKRGAGNFIILDIMRVHASGTGSDLLRFDAETTYYWHEK